MPNWRRTSLCNFDSSGEEFTHLFFVFALTRGVHRRKFITMLKRRTLSIMLIFCAALFALEFDGSFEVVTPSGSLNFGFVERGGARFTTTDEIAKYSDNRFYSAIKRKETLSIGGESYTFSPDNQFVTVAGRTYEMPIATIVTGNALLVPLESFIEIMADRARMAVDFSGGKAVFTSEGEVQRPAIQPQPTQAHEELAVPAAPVAEKKPPEADVQQDKPSEVVADTPAPPRKTKWFIMIDPGHGGKDPGASAKDGTREKTLVLDIAKKVAEAFKGDERFEVQLTRDDDTFIPLQKRTEMANSRNADIFVSIHCNAARNKDARGTQVFFLAPARSDHARATAALENSAIFLEEPTDSMDVLDFIMADVIQNEFLRESSRLAVLVEESIARDAGIPARGPAGAGFYVLNGCFMPAILVEAAFLSNVEDARLLAQESFRQRIADGIADGLREFIRELPE